MRTFLKYICIGLFCFGILWFYLFSAKEVGSGIFVGKYSGFVLEGEGFFKMTDFFKVNASTFSELKRPYYKDKNNVYYLTKKYHSYGRFIEFTTSKILILKNIDPETFGFVAGGMIKDKNAIYIISAANNGVNDGVDRYEFKKMSGVSDPESLEYVIPSTSLDRMDVFKDKFNIYTPNYLYYEFIAVHEMLIRDKSKEFGFYKRKLDAPSFHFIKNGDKSINGIHDYTRIFQDINGKYVYDGLSWNVIDDY